MSKALNISQTEIEDRIFTIRGLQVMLDRHLAEMYQVKAIRLREEVKRNVERFPENFMFQLTEKEVGFMVSQNAIPSRKHLGGYLPFVFTEQGVAMLSAVLRSDIAIKVSIQIMNAFVKMRKSILGNAVLFQRLDKVERKQTEHDHQFEKIFKALESKELLESRKGVSVNCYTKKISRQLKLDIEKYNVQYPPVSIKEFEDAHDRFLIIDNEDLYHIGASLKDLDKKWFAFSKMNTVALPVLNKLKAEKNE